MGGMHIKLECVISVETDKPWVGDVIKGRTAPMMAKSLMNSGAGDLDAALENDSKLVS